MKWVGRGRRNKALYTCSAGMCETCSVCFIRYYPHTHTHLFQEKVQGLEQSLGVVVQEFEEEKRRTEERHHERLQLAR